MSTKNIPVRMVIYEMLKELEFKTKKKMNTIVEELIKDEYNK